MMNDSEGSSDEEGAYMSAAGELSLSPSPHNYETPLNSEISGDSMEERGEVKGETENDPEESLEESILTILTSSNSTNLTRDSLDEAFCRDVEAFSEAFQVKRSTLLCNISLSSGW